jgi:hypothetical protein
MEYPPRSLRGTHRTSLLSSLRVGSPPVARAVRTMENSWVLEQCPVAPGRRATTLRLAPAPPPGKATKTARFLDLVTERHGPLASIPLARVAGISAELAPQLDLNPGAARTALRKAVLAARNGAPR